MTMTACKLLAFVLVACILLQVSECCWNWGRRPSRPRPPPPPRPTPPRPTPPRLTPPRPIYSCSAVEVVGRAQWGARANTSPTRLGHGRTMLFIHHTDTPSCTSKSACSARVRSIQDYHMNVNGWDDIGYNFFVAEDGRAYEGRGWRIQGAHSPNYNSKAIAIAVIGNYASRSPNLAAISALHNLIECAKDSGYLASRYELFGHRDGRYTTCPGDALYNKIKQWPEFSTRRLTKY